MKEIIDRIVEVLRNGGLVLYPTDTVWGIGCDATAALSVARVFALKRREDSKSLVLLARDMEMIEKYVDEVPQMARELVAVNDAPMTIIYPGAVVSVPTGKSGRPSQGLAANCVAADGSVGIRIPQGSPFCMELLERFGRPIVSTSANISGEPTPRSFGEISPEIISGVDCVADPSCEGASAGCPSQIIKLDLDGAVKIIRG